MSSRRKSVSGSAMRVVKRKLSPPPQRTLPQHDCISSSACQLSEVPELVFASPTKPVKRRLSALGGPAVRVKTPSKGGATPSKNSNNIDVDKENVDGSENITTVFRFCDEKVKNDGNASDDFSRDSLDSHNAGRSGSNGSRRSSTCSHDSLESYEGMDRPWCSKDFNIGKAIGKGKFGNVYSAKVKGSKCTVALKVLFKAPMRAANCVHSLRREVEIQCRLKHKNITQLFGYFHDSKNVYLILQYLQQGELFKYVDKQGGKVNEESCRQFVKDIASAVSYLHAHNVAHRDIKPENVLFDMENGKMNLRIADFGCAVVLSPENKAGNCINAPLGKQYTICGTPEYLSPEMLLECGHGLEVDLWALGVFIYDLIVGKTPFVQSSSKNGDYNILETYDKIKQHSGSLFPLEDTMKDELFSEQAKVAVTNFLNPQPEKRTSASEFLTSSWILQENS